MSSSSCLNKFPWISNYGPSFVISASNFNVLYEPKDFFQELKTSFSNAKQRIYISSLYLGTDATEFELIDSIRSALENNRSLRLVILLDQLRAERIDNKEKRLNSRTMIQPLLEQFSSQIDFFLFHTPLLYGFLKKILPARINESWGVQHMKIYLADQTLMISGANLNKSYFVNRQDRYLKIDQCSDLCQFFIDIIETIGQHSFQVKANEPKLNEENHSREGRSKFVSASESFQYRIDVEKSLTKLLKNYKKRFPRPDSLNGEQALVVPLIQMGMFNINADRDFNIYLYSNLPENGQLFLATSYFNMTEEYARELLDRKRADTKIKLLTASPEANGFYGSSGISQYVPAGYTENEREFVERAERKYSRDGQIEMFEYQRTSWTYHAKGLWLYDGEIQPDSSTPILTCVGSPNFGARSIQRDLEAQLAIVTDNKELRRKFHRERLELFRFGHRIDGDSFKQISRLTPFWAPLFMRVFRNFF